MAMNAGPVRSPLLSGVTAATSQPFDASPFTNLTFYVSGSGTISGGEITLEEADWAPGAELPYTGTWSAIGTVDPTDVSGGAQLAYHVGGPGGAFSFGFVRARVSDAITGGGSVSVTLRAV